MEVHKHSQHVTHKKKWNEYLLEFLMLFLAVFLGFFAENIRETNAEHEHEKQYAKLLLSDLRADSAYFVTRNKLMADRLQKHKQFYDLLTSSSRPTDKQLINSFLPLFYTSDLNLTPATYSEMKTSGSLRYIRNQKLIKNLQEYYEILIPRVKQSLDLNNRYYENVIYPFFRQHIRIQDIDDENDSVNVVNPVVMNRTQQTDQELLNIVENYGDDLRYTQTKQTSLLIKKDIELIKLVKEEYDLHDE